MTQYRDELPAELVAWAFTLRMVNTLKGLWVTPKWVMDPSIFIIAPVLQNHNKLKEVAKRRYSTILDESRL